MSKLIQNQIIQPKKCKKDKYRAVYVSPNGESQIVFAKNLSYGAISVLDLKIREFIKAHDSQFLGKVRAVR